MLSVISKNLPELRMHVWMSPQEPFPSYGWTCLCHLKEPSRVTDAYVDATSRTLPKLRMHASMSPQESFQSYGCMCGCHLQKPSRVRDACVCITVMSKSLAHENFLILNILEIISKGARKSKTVTILST
jgi:hypothetical protein